MKKNYIFFTAIMIAILFNLNLQKTESQTLTSFVLLAPEKQLDNVKKIAILNFDGEGDLGKNLVDYMTEYMLQENRGIYDLSGGAFKKGKEGKSYVQGVKTNLYTLIERTQLNKVLAEQNFSQSGLLGDDQAVQVGKILGIDAIISGTVKYTYNDVTGKDKYTKTDGSIYYIDYLTRSIETSVTLKIISVTTAQILATKTFSVPYSLKKSGNEITAMPTASVMADESLKTAAYSLVNYFSISYKGYEYKFDKIKVAEFKDKAKAAENYIENGDIDNAYAIYKAIYDADNYNAQAAKNLGLLYSIVGDDEEALKYIDIAYQIDSKSYADIETWAKARAAMGIPDYLKQFDVSIIKHEFTANSENALAAKVKTSGSSKDRYEVFEKADNTSTVISKVPGGTEFTVVEKSGEWTCIQLLGGKKGYINNANLK